MEGKDEPQKYQGLVSATLASIKPDQAWSLLGDFCSLHKFVPSIAICRMIEGASGRPGCVRYCEAGPELTGSVIWAKERLNSIDHAKMSFSYEIVENNMGIDGYRSTFSVVGCDGGCRIEWMFEAEPVDCWTESGLVEFLDRAVKEMAKSVGAMLGA